jgi:hypothetical protein
LVMSTVTLSVPVLAMLAADRCRFDSANVV